MFNPLKMLGEAKGNVEAMGKLAALQNELSREEAEGHDGNVRVVVNGKMEVKLIEIDGIQDDSVKRAVNDAMKRVQQIIANKTQDLAKSMNL